MNMKWMLGGVALFALFVGGMIVLAQQDQNTPQGTDALFVAYAEELGLDTEKFLADINSDVVQDAVSKDVAEADALTLNSTPTLMIDGEKLSFASLADLEAIVAARIAQQEELLALPEGEHIKGATTPKVIITEFSDFQCPACGTMVPVIEQLLSTYPDDLALVYKNFPLTSIHKNAAAAARAAEAAALQGKFWEMHDLLFERQTDWS